MLESRSPTIEAVMRAHRLLMEDLQHLAEAVRPGANTSLAELRNCLWPTYSHLSEHFRLEEKDGFFDELRRRQPRFERVVRELLEEHRDLKHALEAFRSETFAASGVDEILREKIRTWIEQVRRHERRENDLIQESVDADLGAPD